MAWVKEAISDGEIDALHRAALAACNEDTIYPSWRGSHRNGAGECYNMARWLVSRLGGHVGVAQGHYVWLSPDHFYCIDLTNDHRQKTAGEGAQAWTYTRNEGRYQPTGTVDTERATRFIKRADRIFDNLDKLLRLSLDYAGDAYPAQEPQAEDNSERFNDSWNDPDNYWHDEPGVTTPEGLYQFVYANGQLEVSPNHSHDQLAEHAGIAPEQHTGPFAAGHVVVSSGRATWEVQANVNLHSFLRILKDATKNYGWKWGGMTDSQGQPISDTFAPKGSARVLHYAYTGGHLLVGRSSPGDLVARSDRDLGEEAVTGDIVIRGDRAVVSNVHVDALPSLFEFAADQDLRLYANNDNVIKTIPDLQEKDVYSPTAIDDNPMEQSPPDERLPTGLYRCPACSELFPNWREYQKHRRDQEGWGDPDQQWNGDRGLPEGHHDPIYGDGAHYTEMRQEPGITTGSVKLADLLPQLKQEAAAASQRRGHSLRWEHLDTSLARGTCMWCGAEVDANARPAPNQTHIGGPAVALNCTSDKVPEHPDPWMDNEPGTTTFPEHWSKIVVLPARTWKEAARVDGFMKHATAFNYDNDSHNFYVAYRNGDPVGYTAITPDGGITMMYTPFESEGVGSVLYSALTKHYTELYTHAAHEKTAKLLAKRGWLQVSPVRWKWSKDKAPGDMLEAPLPFIYDVDKDTIHVGNPGARTSDIPGRFTPGGIVEGMYEPGGKVVIRSITSVPYTVRHMIELWYYTHPQLEVKSVHLKDDAGRDNRLATTIRELVAMNPVVHLASTALMNAGGNVNVVGGAVRDVLLGKEPSDFDLMVSGLPGKQVNAVLKKLPGNVVREGKAFAVFHYRHKGQEVHIALPRTEVSTGPRHEDFRVSADYKMLAEEDLFRRDFTINAMAIELRTGRHLDPHGGVADIESRTLRTLGPHSFEEDPLRVLRALSAVSRHGVVPDTETRTQMRESAHVLSHLPAERVQQELDKLFEGHDPVSAIRLAHETGVLKEILPEVDATFGYDQNNKHHELELGEHLLNVLARICSRTTDPDLRLAALLHDIGKPGSAWTDPEHGTSHFYASYVRDDKGNVTGEVLGADHEELGAEMTRELMTRLKYPNDRIARVSTLVEHHMYAGFTTMTGARRFLAKVGDHADDLFILRWADSGGKSQTKQASEVAWDPGRNKALVERVRAEGHAFTVKDLAINGRDLIDMGLVPGPQFKTILSSLMERVIEDPALNEQDTLLRLAHDTIGT